MFYKGGDNCQKLQEGGIRCTLRMGHWIWVEGICTVEGRGQGLQSMGGKAEEWHRSGRWGFGTRGKQKLYPGCSVQEEGESLQVSLKRKQRSGRV